jgi:hypothetical protein
MQGSEVMLMITITYEKLMAAMAFFTACCVAGGWLLKIIKGLKKPSDDINAKLDNDNKRLKELEEKMTNLDKTQPLILRTLYVICEELKQGNDVNGKISKQQEEINKYLFER